MTAGTAQGWTVRLSGHGVYASLSRDASSYWLGADYSERSPTFRADNGFEPSNNYRLGSTWLGGILRFNNSKILENVNGGVDGARKWNFDGVKKDEWINASFEVKFRAAQTGIHSRYLRSNELFSGIQFDGAVEIDQRAGGIDRDLVVAVGVGGDFDFNAVAIPDGLVAVLHVFRK